MTKLSGELIDGGEPVDERSRQHGALQT